MTDNAQEKVFCLGLSRTGTVSLAHALNELGVKTLHFSLEAFVQQERISSSLQFSPKLDYSSYRKWRLNKEISLKSSRDISSLFEQYQGFADLPFPFFYKELNERFPGAKFFYTYRDEHRWLESMKWLYEEGAVIWRHGLLDDEIKYWAYETAVYDMQKLLSAYRQHHKNVLSYFEGNPNFIAINLDKGELHYKTISEFLKLPTVNKPVERLNEKHSTSKLKKGIYWASKRYDGLDLVITGLRKFSRK